MKDYRKLIDEELKRAKRKHPTWPTDNIYRASIMAEEAGEAVKAANQYVLEDKPIENIEKELIQTGAMVLRHLESIDEDRRKANIRLLKGRGK